MPFLGLVAVVLTWPYMALQPGSGFDPSWGAGLHMAAKEGLAFGEEVVFTYGPLGYLQVPTLWYEDTGVMAFLWTVGVHWANCALILWVATRFLGRLLAVIVAVVAASFLVPSPAITGALLAAAYLNGRLPARARRWFPAIAGALAAVALLGKLNHGVEILALAGVALLAAGLRPALRGLGALVGAFVVSLVALWLLTGQPLGALPGYLSLSREVVSGHSEAMTMPGPRDHTILAALAVAGLTAAAWVLARARPMRERVAGTALIALFGFLSFKEGFVRQDFGHEALFVAALVTIPFLIDWGRRLGTAGVAALAGVVAIALFFEPGSVDPLTRFTNAREDTSAIVQGEERRELIDEARLGIAANPALDPEMVARIGEQTVHVGPYLAATAWAYGFEWRPLPVFQDYLAYTSELDDVNADAIDSDEAPRFILRHLDLGLPDRRYTAFNPPRATVRMLCRYRPVAKNDLWVLLERGSDRCGEERPLKSAEAEFDAPIPVPEASPGSIVVAYLDSVELSPTERLRATLFRAKPRTVAFAGNAALEGEPFRLMPGTADDGLLLHAPPAADLPAPFGLSPGADALIVGGGDGSFSVEFRAIPYER